MGYFLLIGRLHLRARLRGAELGDGTIEKIDLVVEVHHWLLLGFRASADQQAVTKLTIDCQPLILVFALRELDHLPQATSSQSDFGILP